MFCFFRISITDTTFSENLCRFKMLQDDVFGVVPFLLAKDGQVPKSGLTFTAKDPITVVFSVNTSVLKVTFGKLLGMFLYQ